MISANMRKEQVSAAELHSLIRKQGVMDFAEIETAILESDGSLTLVKNEPSAEHRELDKK
jgi:uncharacterized membrane protein YcaP (DUF421 family)